MTPDRAELERLRVENRELRDELEAWRGSNRADAEAEAHTQRLAQARDRLGLWPQPAAMLLLMLDRPGHVFSRAAFNDLLPSPHGFRFSDRPIDVQLVHVRKALAKRGLSHGLINRRGLGWTVDGKVAPAIRRLLGEAV